MTNPRDMLRDWIRKRCIEFGDFTLSSGQKSSVYVDLRRTSLFAPAMPILGQVFYETLKKKELPYGLAGEGLGATPLVCATSYYSSSQPGVLQACLVRKQPKGHGMGNQLEGIGLWPKGATVVVLEDTVTTGQSLLKCCEAVTGAGLRVLGVLALLDRTESEEFSESLNKRGIWFQSLFRMNEFLTEGKK